MRVSQIPRFSSRSCRLELQPAPVTQGILFLIRPSGLTHSYQFPSIPSSSRTLTMGLLTSPKIADERQTRSQDSFSMSASTGSGRVQAGTVERRFGQQRSVVWWQRPVNFSDYSFDLGAKSRPDLILCSGGRLVARNSCHDSKPGPRLSRNASQASSVQKP